MCQFILRKEGWTQANIILGPSNVRQSYLKGNILRSTAICHTPKGLQHALISNLARKQLRPIEMFSATLVRQLPKRSVHGSGNVAIWNLEHLTICVFRPALLHYCRRGSPRRVRRLSQQKRDCSVIWYCRPTLQSIAVAGCRGPCTSRM